MFVAELRAVGLSATEIAPGRVAWPWIVPTGPLLNSGIEIGAVVEGDYPDTPPRGPFVRPRLMAANGGGNEHPHGGIHPGSAHGFPDDSWQYWSRPCKTWVAGARDARAYLAFLRRLFDTLPEDLEPPPDR